MAISISMESILTNHWGFGRSTVLGQSHINLEEVF
jgi:hypothetical protein